MSATTDDSMPTPERIFGTLNAYQQTAALKTAIELEVFTAIGQGTNTTATLAQKCQASERGIRTLCDFLVIYGFLEKNGHSYELTRDAAIFLNKKSPAYLGSAVNFLTLPELMDAFKDLTAIVRNGGSLQGDATTTDPDSPKWVAFARSMAPLQTLAAEGLAEILNADAGEKRKVLDIAAGHGMYGITIAKHNPNAEIFAVDWPRVLDVAKENAESAGVAARYHTLPGNAFEADFGKDYDLVLLTGFLHHFDPATIEKLLRKIHTALKPVRNGGYCGICAQRRSRLAANPSCFQHGDARFHAGRRRLPVFRIQTHVPGGRIFLERTSPRLRSAECDYLEEINRRELFAGGHAKCQ